MKIVYIKLINFIGISAAMGLKEVSFAFDKIEQPIIQIYGKNRCGKTVLIQQLHPFSSINLDGDERSDLSLILPGETGIKNIVYEVNGEVYNITHTYRPTKNGHTISSSFMHEDEELNPSGGVITCNHLIEKILGINKYTFQFIINGTQLTSFANMNATQRKTLLNKAMGIDIYDKIHKLATDDYRYTNKLIGSLNHTKEYILSTYGSYETLCALLNQKKQEFSDVTNQMETLKSRLDQLSGMINTIRSQNVSRDMMELDKQLVTYKNVVSELGVYSNDLYDQLVNEQIRLNELMNQLKNQRLLLLKDLDVLYEKKTDIENERFANQKAQTDYQEMVQLKNDIETKIANIQIDTKVESSSGYLLNMRSLGQAINDICKEIVTCLNENHLIMFCDMIIHGIDVSAFLIQEGSVLMDSEKEKGVVSRIRNMINSIEGDYPEDCCYPSCIYHKTHDMLETYFKSYQSTTKSQFTEYDLEQFDHALKNVQTIKRLINIELPDELKSIFAIETIMEHLKIGEYGVDVNLIQHLMEQAAKTEMYTKYVSQLSDIEKTISNMERLLQPTKSSNDMESILTRINEIQSEVHSLETQIQDTNLLLTKNDQQRIMVSQIRNIDIVDVQNRYEKAKQLMNQLQTSEEEYSKLNMQYHDIKIHLQTIANELDTLENVNKQYITTEEEIKKHQTLDQKYKVISEATSSTKGKPVVAIREKVEEALFMTNRLLNVMYDNEIELLSPTIDETNFTLPFRCGTNLSQDIKYGSQSETTLLSLALSLSLASSLTNYNLPLIDELDAYLDAAMRDSFLLMLQEIMSTLKMEQMFLISHSIKNDQEYPGLYQLDIQTVITE